MAERKLGTEAIEALLDYGFSLAFRIKDVTAEDSPGGTKVTLSEIVGSLNLLFKIPTIIGKAVQAYHEWLDMDDEEIRAMKTSFKEKFDIPNDKLEQTFVEVWAILMSLGRIIAIYKVEE